ncbi:MAG: type IV secretory system conjugative DNA transfer family protein [Clostridiales bacterium]|nr:type IV secretory system conjugative DNA transfer family protein [Clostridiales bacterium]
MADEKKEASFGKKFKKIFLAFVLSMLAATLASYILSAFLAGTSIIDIPATINDPMFRTYFMLIFAVVGLVFLIALSNAKFKFDAGGDAKVTSKGGMKKFYDTNWLTTEQLRKDPAFKFHFYEDLHRSDNIGIPIRAELIGNKLNVNMYKPIHTMVIGTTGAGKTTQFINPTIQILSETHAKPCLVITDPKGEIYDDHSEKLRKNGYRILVFDLKEPFQSTRWNPMSRAYEINERAMNLNREVKVHHNDDPRDFSLKCVSQVYYGEWYEFDGYAFADIQSLQSHQASLKQILKTEAFEDLKDIASVLCPIQSNNDPIWERGAKDLVLGTMLAMLEDSENPELGMTKDKFNFYNLSKILNTKDNEGGNTLKSLTDYFKGRDPLSQAVQLANQVVANAEKTTKSYMGIVTDRMGLFSDMGICFATSTNEMDLKTFADQPTAVFIKIPDEKTTRHPIASMFVSQLYKILVDVANKRGGSLARDVYYLLDEFANMPKIENFETIITVARSRRMYFTLILQSYAQLTIKYGQDVAATVKDNCNIHIFIASNDQTTLEEFSKRCGNITVETETTSISKGGEPDAKASKNVNVQQDTRPLIYPAELASLKPNSGECIVSILQQNPIRSVFTPSYMCSVYDMQKAPRNDKLPQQLDEQALFYDIRVRNQKILKTTPNGGGAGGGFGGANPFDF